MRLALTHSSDQTATYLIERLAGVGIQLLRLDTDTLTQTCQILHDAGGTVLRCNGISIQPADVTHVWLRRPTALDIRVSEDAGDNDHARLEWTSALEGFLSQIPRARWINHPAANVAAASKLEQLNRAVRHGLVVPDTVVTQNPAALREFLVRHQGSVVVKPINSGYIERESGQDSQIFTSALDQGAIDNADLVRACPTLFQQLIRKTLDVRVIVVDGQLSATGITHALGGMQILDVRRNNMAGASYRPVLIPEQTSKGIRRLVESYGLRFAALDFAIDESGQWVFFEINPNGQWAWLDIYGNRNVYQLFVHAFRQDHPARSHSPRISAVDRSIYLCMRIAGSMSIAPKFQLVPYRSPTSIVSRWNPDRMPAPTCWRSQKTRICGPLSVGE
jgi:hypothetical protein